MNNLLSYCSLVDAKIRASDKDLSVQLNSSLKNPYQPNPLLPVMLPKMLLFGLMELETTLEEGVEILLIL